MAFVGAVEVFAQHVVSPLHLARFQNSFPAALDQLGVVLDCLLDIVQREHRAAVLHDQSFFQAVNVAPDDDVGRIRLQDFAVVLVNGLRIGEDLAVESAAENQVIRYGQDLGGGQDAI